MKCALCVPYREIERDDLELMTSSVGGPDGTMYQVHLETCINHARLKVRILPLAKAEAHPSAASSQLCMS